MQAHPQINCLHWSSYPRAHLNVMFATTDDGECTAYGALCLRLPMTKCLCWIHVGCLGQGVATGIGELKTAHRIAKCKEPHTITEELILLAAVDMVNILIGK
jgi:hypothetical protein